MAQRVCYTWVNMHHYLRAFDARFTAYTQTWPSWVAHVMNLASTLGHPIIILALLGGVAVVSLFHQLPRIAVASLAAAAVIGLNSLLKVLFQRMRPDTEYVRTMLLDTYSFPSGHSCASMVGFGLLAYLALQYLPGSWGVIVAVVLACLIILVGISRVYLGAHYPSDVLAGWLVGAIGLAVIIAWLRIYS